MNIIRDFLVGVLAVIWIIAVCCASIEKWRERKN
jgi:hypothetical protein